MTPPKEKLISKVVDADRERYRRFKEGFKFSHSLGLYIREIREDTIDVVEEDGWNEPMYVGSAAALRMRGRL